MDIDELIRKGQRGGPGTREPSQADRGRLDELASRTRAHDGHTRGEGEVLDVRRDRDGHS